MKILIGTKNPGKIEGAKEAFEKYFDNVEINGISVDSEVGDQPIDENIMIGAKNRVKNLKKYAKENNVEADYFAAAEAGITSLLGEYIDFNITVIENKDGVQSVGVSQGFQIPEKYMDEIKESELGKVMDRIFDKNSLNKSKGGISILTKDRVTTKDKKCLQFGLVITLKEMNGKNRIDEFMKNCMAHGWLVNRIDVENQIDIYSRAEEEIELE